MLHNFNGQISYQYIWKEMSKKQSDYETVFSKFPVNFVSSVHHNNEIFWMDTKIFGHRFTTDKEPYYHYYLHKLSTV